MGGEENLKKTEPLFSIVIPAWKASPDKLRRCLRSTDALGISCERLLVDDGNGEEDRRVLEEICREFAGVRLLRQPHRGVSAARNFGTVHALGRYVTYLDADDELAPGILNHVASVLAEEPVDLLITRVCRSLTDIPAGEGKDRGIHVFPENILPFDEKAGIERTRLRRYYLVMEDELLADARCRVTRAVHGRFLERSLALQVPFREELAFGEDVIWNFMLTNTVGSLLVEPRCGYCYHENEQSATQSFRPDFPAECRELLRQYRRLIAPWDESLRSCYDSAVVEYFTILCRVYVFAGPGGTARERFFSQVKDPLWQRSFHRGDLRQMKKKYALVAGLARAGQYELLYRVCSLHYRR